MTVTHARDVEQSRLARVGGTLQECDKVMHQEFEETRRRRDTAGRRRRRGRPSAQRVVGQNDACEARLAKKQTDLRKLSSPYAPG